MATRKTAAETVTISKTALRELVSMVEQLEAADAIYKTCQASLFKNFAGSVIKSVPLQSAVTAARAALGDE